MMTDFDKRRFAELLHLCPCLSTLAGRERVITELKMAVPRSHSASGIQDVTDIASTVLNYKDGISRLLDIIRHYDGNTKQTQALFEFLQKAERVSSQDAQLKPAIHNLPRRGRDRRFTGREAQLSELRRTLLAEKSAALIVARGQGGIGKTSLALEYAFRHLETYKTIGWLDAETPTSLMTSFMRLAQLLGVPEAAMQKEEFIRRAVLERLATTDDWLLIYDNAENESVVEMWLPTPCTGHIVITSRTQLWNIAHPLTVPTLPEEECLALLLAWLERSDWHSVDEQTAAAQLCLELGYLTLAVAQAGAFIFNTGMRVKEYLTLFRTTRLAPFEETDANTSTIAKLAGLPDDRNVATTYHLNIERLEITNPAARDLLNLIAFFAPEPFRLELLKGATDKLPERLAATVKDQLLLSKATAELRRYSLATVEDGKITLHRLVGLVIRDRYLDATARESWASVAASILWELYPSPYQYSNWPHCQELLEHASTAAYHAEKVADIEVVLVAAADLFDKTGIYLKQRANYVAARPLLEQGLSIREKELGPNHPDVASSLSNLALLLCDTKEYEQARPLLERAVSICEKELDIEHPYMTASINNLAALLRTMKEYSAARTLLERTLAIDEQIYGTQHLEVAMDMNNLGTVLIDLKEYATAYSLLQGALTIREKILEEFHPYIANTLTNLGSLFYEQGDFKEALTYLERVLVINRTALGEEHPQSKQTLKDLEFIRQKQKDREREAANSEESGNENVLD
jgi:tetratricopeptide (TPR) repeat protein